MERSAIQEIVPGFAALHPGYALSIFINTSFTIVACPPSFARKIPLAKKSSEIINLKN